MNRLKLWLYVLLVTGAAAFTLRALTLDVRKHAIEALDARIVATAARVDAAQRSLANEASAISVLAARDPKLGETLQAKEPAPALLPRRRPKVPPAPPVDPAAEEATWQQAARAAVSAAEKAAGFALPETTQIAAGNQEWLARKALDARGDDQHLIRVLGAAIGGAERRGVIAWNGQLWMTAAAPAGPGGGIAVLVPLDAAWLAAVAAGSGAELTLAAPGVKPTSTAPPTEAAAAVASAPRGAPSDAGRLAPVDAGRLAPVDLGLDAVKLPKVGLLFATAPGARVQAVPLSAMQGAFAVVSASAQPLLAPLVRFQWWTLAGIAVALLVGLVFGLLVGPTELAAPVPEALFAAAGRIERGDFAARAPALAGQLGTVAAALNRAVEAASKPAAEAPSLSQEFFARPAASGSVEPSAFEFPPRPAAMRAPEPAAPAARPAAPPAETGPLGGGAFEATPVPAAERAAPSSPPTTAPELLQAAARAAPPPGEVGGEDAEWGEVFEDFLRVRAECGETADGLTFVRFRQKLEANKANLVTKYACRTVRFQVYVKEGKAALKATPVK